MVGRSEMAAARAAEPMGRSSQRQRTTLRNSTMRLTLPRLRSISTGSLKAATAKMSRRTVVRTGMRAHAAASSPTRRASQRVVAVWSESIVKGRSDAASGGA